MTDSPRIMILGVGNKLLTDEGFGIHVIEKLMKEYEFSQNVSVMDGGVLGIYLLGFISEADKLIVIDVIRNNGKPGTMYRIENDDIPDRVRAKNSLHQVDFLETMTLCKYGLDKAPESVILGVEPLDIQTYSVELTNPVKDKIDDIIEKVLKEVEILGGTYSKKGA